MYVNSSENNSFMCRLINYEMVSPNDQLLYGNQGQQLVETKQKMLVLFQKSFSENPHGNFKPKQRFLMYKV